MRPVCLSSIGGAGALGYSLAVIGYSLLAIRAGHVGVLLAAPGFGSMNKGRAALLANGLIGVAKTVGLALPV